MTYPIPARRIFGSHAGDSPSVHVYQRLTDWLFSHSKQDSAREITHQPVRTHAYDRILAHVSWAWSLRKLKRRKRPEAADCHGVFGGTIMIKRLLLLIVVMSFVGVALPSKAIAGREIVGRVTDRNRDVTFSEGSRDRDGYARQSDSVHEVDHTETVAGGYAAGRPIAEGRQVGRSPSSQRRRQRCRLGADRD